MAKIVYKQGNLLEAPENVWLHGCNAQGVMGKGIALSIKEKFPFACEAYRSMYEREGLKLGTVVWAIRTSLDHPHERPIIIGNMITQEYWQKDKAIDGRNVSYEALCSCMREVDKFIKATQDGTIESVFDKIQTVGMPLVGAGLGSGRWSVINKIIEEESRCFTPIVYTLDGIIPQD